MNQKTNSPIDNKYCAKSHSVNTLIEWHKANHHVSRLVLAAQIIFPLLASLLLLLFFVYIIELEPRNIGKKLNNQINSSLGYIQASGESKVLIILTISVLFNVLTLISDGFALKEYRTLDGEVKKFYDLNVTEFRLFYAIPYVMTAMDALSLLLFIIVPVGWFMYMYYSYRENDRNKINWSIMLYTILAPLSCIATHAYHIIIAFIDNSYHASNVLLLYVAVLFIHVVVFQKIYYYLLKWANSADVSACCSKIKENQYCWMAFLIGCYLVGVVILFAIVGLTIALLIKLPIDKALENAPSNIYVIYQGSVAVIAALVTFQVFFRETNSISEVFIKARDKLGDCDDWDRMSEKEKEIYLARLLLEYVYNNREPLHLRVRNEAAAGVPTGRLVPTSGSPRDTPLVGGTHHLALEDPADAKGQQPAMLTTEAEVHSDTEITPLYGSMGSSSGTHRLTLGDPADARAKAVLTTEVEVHTEITEETPLITKGKSEEKC